MRGSLISAIIAAFAAFGAVAAQGAAEQPPESETPKAKSPLVTLYEGEIKESKLKGIDGFKITHDGKTKKNAITLGKDCRYSVDSIGRRRGRVVVLTFRGEKIECGQKLPGRIFGRITLGRENPAGVIQFHGGPGSKEIPVDVDVTTFRRAVQ